MTKTLLKGFALVALAAITFSACNKNDFNYEKEREEKRKSDSLENLRIKELIKLQAPELKAFAEANFNKPFLDTATGIWFEIVKENADDTYQYKTTTNGGIVAPTVKVEYKGSLLTSTNKPFDQTELDKPREFNLGNVIAAWGWAFLPKTFKYNGIEVKTAGLTAKGLKKGAIIKIATPSPWGYDRQIVKDKDGTTTIPANSPLYFQIEVNDIK